LLGGDFLMQPRTVLKWILILVLFPPMNSHAVVKDIHSEKLPQLSALPKVLADITELEPYLKNWSGKWPYPVPKATVVARMKADLKVLERALKDHPDNVELLLLTALAAHYAYNVDVNSANDLIRTSVERAHALAPDDLRIMWFRDIHLCQANFVNLAMADFLRIESTPAAGQLPSTFWEDYALCADLANMPAHVLRAASRVAERERSDLMKLVIERAGVRFITPDPQSAYKPEQMWTSAKSETGPRFISSMCDVAFQAKAEWKLNFPQPEPGQCLAQLETGPYSANGREVVPNILLLVRPAKPGETLDDFLKSLLRYPDPKAIPAGFCPATQCLAAEAVVKDRYKESGGGHGIFTVFERDEPDFPGLIFEAPAGPKVPSDGVMHNYAPPSPWMKRLKGKLYYVVLLDSAESVLDRAKMDYESFLKAMQIE
jgi:hypothetical protein